MNTRIFLPASALLLSAGMLARADVKYLQEMVSPGLNGGKPFSSVTTYKRPGGERVETSYAVGPTSMKSVTITNCAKREVATLDEGLKMYYSTPLVPAASAAKSSAPKAGAATGTMTMTLLSLKELGTETVNGTRARTYEVTIRTQTSGCLGNSDTTSKQQIAYGAAPSTGGDGGCPTLTSDASGAGASTCRMAMVRKGNWAAYDKITRGTPLRTRVLGPDGKLSSETRTRSISRAKLPASLFAVPAGYKRVSKAEFDAARQKAMLEAMTAGSGGSSE